MNSDIETILNNIELIYKRKEDIDKIMEQIGYKLTTVGDYKIPPGIQNFGNTCFHNSTMQLLYRIKELSKFIIHPKINAQYKDNMVPFIDLLKIMNDKSNNNSNQVISSESDLVTGKICPMIKGYTKGTQQDAVELLLKILENLSIDCTTAFSLKDISKQNICKDNNKIKNFPKDDPRNFINMTYQKLVCKLDYILPKKGDPDYGKIYNLAGSTKQTIIGTTIKLKEDTFDEIKATDYLFNKDLPQKYLNCSNFDISENLERPSYDINVVGNDKKSISELLQTNRKKLQKLLIEKESASNKEQLNKNINDLMINMMLYKDDNKNELSVFTQEDNLIPNKYFMIKLLIFDQNKNKIIHDIKLDQTINIQYLENNIGKSKDYELVGTIIHAGSSINFGHYYSYIKYGDQWYEFNDSQRSTINSSDVKSSGNAVPYLVLYQEKTHQPFEYIDPSSIPDKLEDYLILLKVNYGYDFDGVLHTSVSQPDNKGQRHPTHFHGPFTPFVKIIEKIKTNLADGDSVYIITARSSNSKQYVNEFLDKNNLSQLKDKVYYTNNQDKTKVLNELQINDFYDDSCLRINELYSKMQSGLLPHLKNLHFVIPEELSWKEVDDEVIKQNCEKYKK